MKKTSLLALLFGLMLAATPAWAQTDPAASPQNQAPPQGMFKPGCRMMGGSGMGMGWGMRGGPGMGRGMWHDGRGHGMMGRRSCMMGGCWRRGMGAGWGSMGSMRSCPGPRRALRAAYHEIKGYQMEAAALGLSEDQLGRLDSIDEHLTTTAIKSRANLEINAIDLRRVMAGKTSDITKADAIIDRQGKIWTGLQKTAIKAVVDARNVLTAQQRQKAREMMMQAGPMWMRWQKMHQERDN